jgi:hypothetical protein
LFFIRLNGLIQYQVLIPGANILYFFEICNKKTKKSPFFFEALLNVLPEQDAYPGNPLRHCKGAARSNRQAPG